MKSADFYDWVIIGDHFAGQCLLSHLTDTIEDQQNQHRCRVAWVLPSPENLLYYPSYTTDELHNLALKWQAKGIDVVMGAWRFIPDHEVTHQGAELALPLVVPQPGVLSSRGTKAHGLEVLSEQNSPSIHRKLGARVLYASHWVAAIATTPLHRVINLAPPHYILAEDLCQAASPQTGTNGRLTHDSHIPQIHQIALLGDHPQALPNAQKLACAGYDVTLILPQSRLLPEVDGEIVQILQAHLEVQGIKIHIGGKLTAVKALASNHTRLWLGQTAIDTERLVLAAPPRLWLAEKYQLPPDTLWCQTAEDMRQIGALSQKPLPKFDWRSWVAPWGISPPDVSPPSHFCPRLRIPTQPPLLHYGVIGEEFHRLIVPATDSSNFFRDSRDEVAANPNDSKDVGVAKIQVTDGRIVGFSSIGQTTFRLGHLMGWLIEQKATYTQWQSYQRQYPEI